MTVSTDATATGTFEHLRFQVEGQTSQIVDKRCFIASQVYGGEAWQTNALRVWRDKTLMLQAWLLRHKGFETAPYGYLAINKRRTRQRTAHRVKLLDDSACVRVINRYLDVTERSTQPRKSRGKKCNSCGHRIACHE